MEMGCSMTSSDSALLQMLQQAGNDPLAHNDWINGWRKLLDDQANTPNTLCGFSQIEHVALGYISNVKITETHAHLGSEVSRLLASFKHPVFLVDGDGLISAQNTTAQVTYDVNIGDNIGDLPVTLKLAEPVEEVVKAVTHSKFAKGNAVFRQAFSRGSTHELTLAITKSSVQSGESNVAALVFIISSKFSEQTANLIRDHFGLTSAECQILISFVEGFSLKEIAKDRKRSYATVRTQFNSLTTKMGACNQAALLRTALSISDYSNEIDKFSMALEHPFRRPANIMRPGGRMVDVCFSGDPAGTPLLHIPCMGANRFSAKVEKLLFEAGLYMITICPPAYGKTDPQPAGCDRRQCQADDIEAVLDMLSIDNCALLVSVSGTYSAFDMASSLPGRISRILLVAACPPGKYWMHRGTGAPWIDAIFRIDEKFAAVRQLIAAANLKALVTLGLSQWYRHQLADNKKDIETLMQPENVVELEYALQSATAFGMGTLLEDIPVIFTDYSEKIALSGCNISIIHGVSDPLFPIQSMRDLQADYTDRMELFEIKDAGFTVLLSHTEEVVHLMSTIVSDVDSGLAGMM